MAGYAVMAAAPLVVVALMLSGGHPRALALDRHRFGHEARGAEFAKGMCRPVISISIEPAALPSCSEAEPPIVFPGYLLPADGSEEPAHAGS